MRAASAENEDSRLFFGILFSVVGYGVKMLVEVPLTFGAFGGATVPGAVLQLSQLSAVGLYLLAVHAFRRNRALLPFVIVLLAADMMVGALEFSKFTILLPLMMFLLAWLASRMTIWRAALATALFVSAYSSSQPFIEFGRLSLDRKYHDARGRRVRRAFRDRPAISQRRAARSLRGGGAVGHDAAVLCERWMLCDQPFRQRQSGAVARLCARDLRAALLVAREAGDHRYRHAVQSDGDGQRQILLRAGLFRRRLLGCRLGRRALDSRS